MCKVRILNNGVTFTAYLVKRVLTVYYFLLFKTVIALLQHRYVIYEKIFKYSIRPGSNPAEAVGFLGRKNPQHAFLRMGSKAVGPMS